MEPWESLVIGFVGGAIGCLGTIALERMRIDDPVGCIPIHAFTGMWGLICVGLFVEGDPLHHYTEEHGLFKGGGFKQLGFQVAAVFSIAVWTAAVSFIMLFIIDKTIGLRMTQKEELEGADIWEHGIYPEIIQDLEDYTKSKVPIIITHLQNGLAPPDSNGQVMHDVSQRPRSQTNVTYETEGESQLKYALEVMPSQPQAENGDNHLQIPVIRIEEIKV